MKRNRRMLCSMCFGIQYERRNQVKLKFDSDIASACLPVMRP